MKRLLKTVLLPPFGPIALIALGLLARRRRRRTGNALMLLGAGALLLAMLPIVAAGLLRSLQTVPALPPGWTAGDEGAIVVLSGDQRGYAPEAADGASVGPMTLERLRYGVRLARATGLPLLVSGGVIQRDAPAVARSMADVLEFDFELAPRWIEDRSRDTRENAEFTARVLSPDGVGSIVLVTHAWHMPRALAAFERRGLVVTPAPCGFRAPPDFDPSGFVPSGKALLESYWGLHEWLGRAWYTMVD